ncbi:GDSL esterase/lipase APG-like [Wolffia australiana]
MKLREGKTSVEKESYMGSRGRDFYAIFVSLLVLRIAGGNAHLLPAIILFGNSSEDMGKNYLPTLFKSVFLPYGRDFVMKSPTGRFCNGKLATDISTENLGFDEYPRAYLSPEASGKNLLIGANFGSACSSYYDATVSTLLSQQLEYYKEYQSRLEKVARGNTSSIITEALYIVSTGNTDFVQNYYVNPLINKVYFPEELSSFLISIFSGFIRVSWRLAMGLLTAVSGFAVSWRWVVCSNPGGWWAETLGWLQSLGQCMLRRNSSGAPFRGNLEFDPSG